MRLDSYVRTAIEEGAAYCKVMPASKVVTAEWVRLKCQFGCGAYGTRLTCPPFSPFPALTRRLLGEFTEAMFMVFTVNNARSERSARRRARKIVASLERELFLDGYYSALALAFGPCNLCPSCDTASSCRYPELARPSMEACGIDVYATAANAGFPLRVVRSYEEGCSLCALILVGDRAPGVSERVRKKTPRGKERRNAE